MKHVINVLGVALVAGALTASAAAQAPAPDRLSPDGEAVGLATGTPAAPAAPFAPAADKPFPGNVADVVLYVDIVNSPRPKAAAPRPKSCTQLSTVKRGERPVVRVWGVETGTGAVLSPENVKYAYLKIPGLANIKLNWGGHGSGTARSWFWTAGWDVATDYPLGVLPLKIVFKTEAGKFGIYTQEGLPAEYRLTVLP